MTEDREKLLKEIDHIVDDLWSGIATQKNIAEEMIEKVNIIIQRLRVLKDELREEGK